jgi:heat shock protein HtpX
MTKRALLFAAANIAVLLVLTLVVQIAGIDQLMASRGWNWWLLLVTAAVLGVGGAFVSLALSKWMAKRTMGVHTIVIARNPQETWLVTTIRRHAQATGIVMPEIGIFESPDINAFATGARRDRALVAVSSSLLNVMSQREAEAVLGHEITHIANGDMVTLTLIQGVVNTFVIFLSRTIGGPIDSLFGSRTAQRRGPCYFLIMTLLQVALGFLATMIVASFSRQREFRADAGGMKLSNRQSMIAALERLQQRQRVPLPDQMAAFGFAGGRISNLFRSHPPTAVRIATLRGTA